MPLSRSREDEGLAAKADTAGKVLSKEQLEQHPAAHPAAQQPPDSTKQHKDVVGKLEEAGHQRDIPVAPPKEWKVLQEDGRAVQNPVEKREPLHGDAQRVPAARNNLEKKPLAEDLGGEREAKAGRDVHHQQKNFLKAVEAATAPIQREQPGAAKVQGVAGKSLERDSGTDLKAKTLSQVEPKDLAVLPDSSSNRNVAVREQHPREREWQRGALAEGGGGRQRDGKEEDPREEPRGGQGRGGPSNGADRKPGPQDAPAQKSENGAAAPRDPQQQQERDVKPNRELKLQGGLDLRRKRRDLLPPEQEEEEEGEEEEAAAAGAGGVLIGLNPLPDVKVNDLRSALETRLSQVAEGAQHLVRSRHIQQVTHDRSP